MKVRHNDKYYDARVLASNILRRYSGIREMAEYEALSDRIFDHTSACDKKEHNDWMQFYMAQAIEMDAKAVRIQFPNSREGARFEAALQFIVAYDMIA